MVLAVESGPVESAPLEVASVQLTLFLTNFSVGAWCVGDTCFARSWWDTPVWYCKRFSFDGNSYCPPAIGVGGGL